MARPRRGLSYKQLRTKAQRQADRAAAAARKAAIPTPGSARGDRAWRRFLPDTPEVRWLQDAARAELLAGGTGEYLAELRGIARAEQRRRFNAARRTKAKAKPKAKPAWIRVKAHRRRRPGGGR